MANSRRLLVYVLALVLCLGGGNGDFWASASPTSPTTPSNTNSISQLSGGAKEPLIGTIATPQQTQQQTRPQHHYAQFYSQQQQQQQQKQAPVLESSSYVNPPPSQQSPPSSSSPSTGLPPPSHSKQQSAPSTKQLPQLLQPNSNNAPSTMSVKNGFGFSAGSSRAGPYTSGFSYISGRTLNQPSQQQQQHYMTDYELIERPSPSKSAGVLTGMQGLTTNWGDWFHSTVDLKSVLMGAALGAGATMYSPGGIFANLFPFAREEVEELRKNEEAVAAPSKSDDSTDSSKSAPAKPDTSEEADPAPDAATANNTTSRRRRRDVEFDTDLTELATMVLSAIQSGECMQRSICLLGSQLGSTDKGKMGFLLVDKLIPESVQGSQYFVTLKKALRSGESYCDRFRCRFN